MYYIYVYVCISSLLLAHTNYAIFIGLSLLLPPSVANPPWRELKRPQRRQSPLASICMVGQVSKPLQAAAFFFLDRGPPAAAAPACSCHHPLWLRTRALAAPPALRARRAEEQSRLRRRGRLRSRLRRRRRVNLVGFALV